MSTRCLVGIKDGEEFKYIYVHRQQKRDSLAY